MLHRIHITCSECIGLFEKISTSPHGRHWKSSDKCSVSLTGIPWISQKSFLILTGIPGKTIQVLRNSGIPQDFESAGFGILHKLPLYFVEILKLLGTPLEKIDQRQMMVYWWFSAGNSKVLVFHMVFIYESDGFYLVFHWTITKLSHFQHMVFGVVLINFSSAQFSVVHCGGGLDIFWNSPLKEKERKTTRNHWLNFLFPNMELKMGWRRRSKTISEIFQLQQYLPPVLTLRLYIQVTQKFCFFISKIRLQLSMTNSCGS